jgi:hypothetical protein
MAILHNALRKAWAKFILNLGNPCNIEYSKSNNIQPQSHNFTEEQLNRYAEYIKFFSEKNIDGRRIMITVYGDDTFKSLSSLNTFASSVKDYVDIFKIDIDVPIKQEQLLYIKELWKILGKKLKSDIYYSFSLENETEEERQQYDSFYYNIRWLFTRGIGMGCVVKLNPHNANKILDVFNDFLKCRDEIPNLNCIIKLDCCNQYDEFFDDQAFEDALKLIEAHLDENPELGKNFVYSPNHALKKVRENTFISNIFCEMTAGGKIYPGYDVQFMTDAACDEFVMGNISEDFNVLEEKRNILLSKKSEFACIDNNSFNIFRSIPWKDDKEIYNIKASEQICRLHNLLTKYLYEATVFSNEQE